MLMRDGVDVNAIDPLLKLAPIHSIVKRERPDRLELLLTLLTNSDVNVDLKTPDGDTPLHLAVEVRGSFLELVLASGIMPAMKYSRLALVSNLKPILCRYFLLKNTHS